MNRPFFSWSDDYSVGIRLIDNDHRELFSIINDLHKAIEQRSTISFKDIGQITGRLLRYTQEHFHREESLMAEYGYPDLKNHQEKHRKFLKMVYAIRKIEKEQPERLDPMKLLDFLTGWLRRHIIGADQDYVPYLKGEYGRRKSDLIFASNDKERQDSRTDDIVTVNVQVPRHQVDTLRRCAILLSEQGSESETLARMTDPLSSMTTPEALKIAAIVLRNQTP